MPVATMLTLTRVKYRVAKVSGLITFSDELQVSAVYILTAYNAWEFQLYHRVWVNLPWGGFNRLKSETVEVDFQSRRRNGRMVRVAVIGLQALCDRHPLRSAHQATVKVSYQSVTARTRGECSEN